MINRKYFLIKYLNPAGLSLTLHRNGKAFFANTHGNDKEYRTLEAARRKAKSIRRTATFNGDRGDLIVVEVSFEACNPLLPDGFYKPVYTVVSSL
jgi:hypothetical protein